MAPRCTLSADDTLAVFLDQGETVKLIGTRGEEFSLPRPAADEVMDELDCAGSPYLFVHQAPAETIDESCALWDESDAGRRANLALLTPEEPTPSGVLRFSDSNGGRYGFLPGDVVWVARVCNAA